MGHEGMRFLIYEKYSNRSDSLVDLLLAHLLPAISKKCYPLLLQRRLHRRRKDPRRYFAFTGFGIPGRSPDSASLKPA
jgi:hypothetical protein